ncbi:hypothetical protein ACIB24_12750 [Spongisporangium articulatum]|uniref:Lysyl-tRNA synthetase n=1 Tax=Spongisporangium articulatum TaxID=3362603 RepID=A0ABW8ANH7_9ACTN
MLAFIGAIIPTVGVSLVFWLAVKSMTEADRRERAALARVESQKNSSGPAE